MDAMMMDEEVTLPARGAPRSLLIVDDDAPFRVRLGRAMEKRGFEVILAEGVSQALDLARQTAPAFAVIDLRLEDGNGMSVVPALREIRGDAKIVVLTGYGNIASAVSAVKAGAVDYLAKPADADQVEAALLADTTQHLPPPPDNPMSADRVRWEHILRVFEQCNRNVSETARRLRMHRRTLQRILNKHAPRG